MTKKYPYIITISSEKGGVGKTTLATNLAIYLKAMREDIPVTIFSFDNHFTVDKMFKLNDEKPKGDVHDLLMGRDPETLITIGQYGIGYIASSTELSDIHERFKGPMTLTKLIANSTLSGIIIIDTRPDLNILTQNALYAADKVLIPVKDMPSLENCRNIFALFDNRGIDKNSLALVPCLIDERIKFEGIFKDQKTLLRAFAANRGYKCINTFISKSPKVESLNTNPDGKIYPILTHARGTDVHGQFTEISREIIRSFDSTKETRTALYHAWMLEKETKKRESYIARLEGIADKCPICGVMFAEKSDGRGFYYETSDRISRGFIHENCFIDMLSTSLYSIKSDSQAFGAAKMVVAEKANSSVSLFMPAQERDCDIKFMQFSGNAEEIFNKQIDITGFTDGMVDEINNRLYLMLNETLSGYEGKLRSAASLYVYPVDKKHPEAVMKDETYRSIQKMQQAIAAKIAA